MKYLLAASLLSFCSQLLASPAPSPHAFNSIFVFKNPRSEDAVMFKGLIEHCAANYKGFNEMLRELAVQAPKVRTSFSTGARMVSNRGFPPDPPVYFQIDLKDLEVFPQQVPTDDIPSWATTRCEFIAHELAELSVLVAAARAAAGKQDEEVARAVRDAYARAHRLGIQEENRLRQERAEVNMRSEECNVPLGRDSNAEYSYVVFGEHTQEMLFIGPDLLDINYLAKVNKCPHR